MTLTELRYIVTLAQEQHFGQAAERCHVSQPTLSIAVKKLEQELGIELFERSKNKVSPTPTGENVIAQAQKVLEEASRILDIAAAGKDQLNSPLRVGGIFTIGPYLFPQFIPKLRDIAPHMPLVVEESYTATLRRRLRNGDLDVIIIALPFTEPDVVTQPLYTEPFVVLMPKDHPLARLKAIKPADLDGENILLLGEGHCFREQVLEALPNLARQQGRDGERGIRTDTEGSSLETMRHMVSSGLGITILPLTAVLGTQNLGQNLVTRHFAKPVPCRTAALAWRASFPRHRAVDALRQAILETQFPGLKQAE
ncbi:MAG: LysR substrate-binding domain-containing protein [Pseudomonadota bacterium]|nr:LysR substrate-binding domain-containing protein [Pseudomonadota bacterium]